ncbi:MAG: hypothetical protein K0Q70_1159 [Rhodospirillales bacterium]|jgi:hypothetical protein|nr:hypothetical protein [Rhodospirillales bacterium]
MAVSGIGEYVNIQLQKNQFSSMDSIALISKQLVARMQSERKDEAVNFSRPDLARANNEKARLMEYKTKVADELSAMTKAKGAVEWVISKLNTMTAKAQAMLGSTDPDARAALATEFNEALDFINAKVDGASQKIGYQTINLVGDVNPSTFKADNLYIHTGDKGGRTMVEGAYMGSNYNIVDEDGYLWTYSDSEQALIQRENTASGTATGNKIAFDGLTVDSFDHDTGAVTLGGSGGGLTGTVQRGGIGVLDSKFYGDFATDADVQNAIDDMLSAMTYVKSEGSSIKADATVMLNANKTIQGKISNLNRDIDAITREELDEAGAKTKAANLKMSLAINNINLVAQHNTALVQNLLDMTQGLARAPGVFGSMGY